MRAPYQILSIPYRYKNKTIEFCIFHRTDCEMWQFVSGGGEDDETPFEAAKRETLEETGSSTDNLIQLTCIAHIPVDAVLKNRRAHWDKSIYVIPEYSFAFECDKDPILSCEHDKFLWLGYEDARKMLKWDSNKVAMYEVKERLRIEYQ